jgi:hypothetical protein
MRGKNECTRAKGSKCSLSALHMEKLVTEMKNIADSAGLEKASRVRGNSLMIFSCQFCVNRLRVVLICYVFWNGRPGISS